jgi:hypothetical protein
MRDSFVDVTLEVPARTLRLERDPSRFVFEKMRDRAEELCERNFGRLRTDSAPEIIVSNAVDRSTGDDMVLCASRWPVVIPDAVAP